MSEALRALLGHRPYGANFEYGYMFEDVKPAPHVLIWDSPAYIAAIRGTPKIEMRTLRLPCANSPIPYIPTICFWFHGERIYCAYIDFKYIEARQEGIIDKMLDEHTEIKIVIVDREVTNYRRLIMKNPIFPLVDKVINEIKDKDWFSNDFLEARLRVQSDYYEAQLWDMGERVHLDLDSVRWDKTFTIQPKNPPLFKRYRHGVDPTIQI